MKNVLSLTFPIGLILCGAGATALFVDRSTKRHDVAAVVDGEKGGLDAAATYYVFVSEIEVFTQALDGSDREDWDDDDDAPDLSYTIEYDGKMIFKSAERADTFIGNWRGITVPIALKDLQTIVKGDVNLGIDFEKIITAARVKGDTKLVVKISDEDYLSPDDDVGKIPIKMADLYEGTNEIVNKNRSEGNGWKRLEVVVVKREGSVKDFLLPLLREMTEEQKSSKK